MTPLERSGGKLWNVGPSGESEHGSSRGAYVSI